MIPVLAQLSSAMAQPLVQWLVGASAAAFLLNQGLDLWKKHFRENPAPSDTYATKEQLREAHGRIGRERNEINVAIAKIEAAQAAASIRVDGELQAIRVQIEESRQAAEARVEKLRTALDDQTKLIIDVIREAK